MVKIRMSRFGRRKHPTYRMVVADERRARDGRFIEILGWYQPLSKDKTYEVDGERALHWLKNGAVPSETAKSILRKMGVLKQFHDHKAELAAARKARRAAKREAKAEPSAASASAPAGE